MTRIILVLVTLIFLVHPSRADDQLPVAVLQDIKAATVFVKIKAGPYQASGSGFLMKVDGETGLIVTNEHVAVPSARLRLPPAVIDVVFHSGRKNELVLRAELLAADNSRDLAVLRVKSKDLPKSFDLAQKVELVETMPVYLFGFPFGEVLSTTKGNPAITVGKGSVSSIRENEFGETAKVQIDGDLNPGNSGGPVVDAKGRLVGVAVAKIRNTHIGLAIPSAELTKMLNGRIAELGLHLTKVADGAAEIRVVMRLIDPLGKMSKVQVRVAPTDSLKEALKADKDGKWPPLPEAQLVELKIDGQQATGTFTVRANGKTSLRYTVQPVYTNGDKVIVHSQPANPYTIDFTKPPMTPGTTPDPKLGGGLGIVTKPEPVGDLKVTTLTIGRGQGPNCLCWAKDGKAFYYLDGVGTVHRISFPELKHDAFLETGKKCTWLSVSAEGAILTVPDDQEMWLLDAVSLKVVSKLPTAHAKRVGASPALSYAYAADMNPGGGTLSVIDLKAGKIVKQYTNSDFIKQGVNFDYPIVTQDGKHLFATGGFGPIYRFDLDGATVKFGDASPGILSGRFEGLSVSGDGKFVCAPTGGGNGQTEGEKQEPYTTAIFSGDNLKTPRLRLRSGAYPLAVGFDTKSGLLYAQNGESHLILYDTEGIKLKAYTLSKAAGVGGTRQFLVHPDGRRLLVLGGSPAPDKPAALWYVELPTK
jgi:S1-C subfamily serine protease